jgi:hypothetical protein
VGAELFHADRQIVMKLIFAFLHLASAPENLYLCVGLRSHSLTTYVINLELKCIKGCVKLQEILIVVLNLKIIEAGNLFWYTRHNPDYYYKVVQI